MTFFRICIFAICGLIFSLILKSLNSKISSIVMTMVLIWSAAMVVGQLSGLLQNLNRVFLIVNIGDENVYLLFKVIGISYITHFTGALLKDHGYSAVSELLEILSRLTIAGLCVPIVLTLFETVGKML